MFLIIELPQFFDSKYYNTKLLKKVNNWPTLVQTVENRRKSAPKQKTVPKIYTKRKSKLKSLATLAYRNRNFEMKYIPFFKFEGQNFPRIHHKIK
jgi:hypothetical protein